MQNEPFASQLAQLAQKYSVAGALQIGLEPGAVTVQCDKGSYRFFYNFAAALPQDAFENVPLLHWRSKRRYSELKNIVEQGLVQTPLALRIHHIVAPDSFATGLADLLAFEADLVSFLVGRRVNKVFADFSGELYMNCICSTQGGIKVSMELGFSPEGSEPVLLHEVVAKTGIASDVAVDTQTQQYPLYVFKGAQTQVYNDVDAELYGLDNTQADCIRFILWALSDTARIEELKQQADYLQKVWRAAVAAGEHAVYTAVEG